METRSDARDRLRGLTLGTKILLATTILLLIDMFLAWQSVDVGPFEVSQNAWSGFWGVALGLLTIAMLVWIAVQLANVDLSRANLPVTHGLITLGLGVLIFAFALLKNITDDYSAIWSYIGVLLAAGVAYGAWTRSRELEDASGPGASDRYAGTTAPGASTEMHEDDRGRTGATAGTRDTTPETTGRTPAAPPSTMPGAPGGGTGATTSTSGTSATTSDVERDDVEPQPPPPPSSSEPPRDTPSTTTDDR